MEFNACAHADRKVCSKCVFGAAQSMPCEHNECLRNCRDCYMLLLTEACNTDKEMAAAAALAKEQSLRRSRRIAAKPRIDYDEEREEREAKYEAWMAKKQESAVKRDQKRAEKEAIKEVKRKVRAESHKAVAAVREAALKAAKEAVKDAWRQARAAEKQAVEAAREAFWAAKDVCCKKCNTELLDDGDLGTCPNCDKNCHDCNTERKFNAVGHILENIQCRCTAANIEVYE
jgi:hypothetical protein